MSTHESSHRLVLGALLLTVIAAIAVLYAREDDRDSPALTNTSAPQTHSAPVSPSDPIPTDIRQDPQRTPSEPALSRATAHKDILICLRADNRQPLAGISLYQNNVVRLGPTGADGRLAVGDLGWDTRILWGEGWMAQRLRGAKVPAEVLFVPANSGIQVALKNASPQHAVIRSILQMHGPSTPPEGIWSPKLQITNWDRLAASGVPPGTYDIYVWISKNMGTPEPYQLQAVELKPAQQLQLTIDLIADKQDTTEDDS